MVESMVVVHIITLNKLWKWMESHKEEGELIENRRWPRVELNNINIY